MIPEDSILRRHYLTELKNTKVPETYSNFILFVSVAFVLLVLVLL
ncbi:hypothetical protein UFOVP84_153 [uncultured Caudovirales phage]|uniref:Uncharacterized protein n=1 Tax=uncultured Caudovirales phage TaxID=2100421 RepID=A0A6J5L478_9CAUD|nr:hypothetical protein UFOVP84_153 [uncultured Caudovirales phage]